MGTKIMNDVPEKLRKIECMGVCRNNADCGGFTFKLLDNTPLCQLASSAAMDQVLMTEEPGSLSYKLIEEVNSSKHMCNMSNTECLSLRMTLQQPM